MFFEKNNRFSYTPTILVAPLDWGLGHATRCIPFIYKLLNSGATVIIAADGPVKILLQKEFPQLTFITLPGYKIQYSYRSNGLGIALLKQLPRLIKIIYKEHQWLKKIMAKYGITAVISDNRMGLYNRSITSVYITHQLCIKAYNGFIQRLLQKAHYFFINKYNQCWVPDNEAPDSLAGDLSHPNKRPQIPVSYTGIVSRFKKSGYEKKYDLLVMLSGPEPQRTVFEDILLPQLQKFEGRVLLIRGLPGDAALLTGCSIEVHNHLEAADLSRAIQQSHMVICRSGYSSVMDLVTLQQKAVLVPTPGQTEQEYLANYLQQKKIFYSTPQSSFSLANALQAAASFPYIFPALHNRNYEIIISDFVKSLCSQ
jgi:UDP-N-acetylglucosamine transferase subunit ALG13